MPDDDKSNHRINDINQEFKEKEIREKAEKLGIPYVNLIEFSINPDVLSLLEKEDSEMAGLVVFFQVGKKIRVAASDPENVHAKKIIQNFKTENFAVNINLASEESVKKIQALYDSDLFKKEVKEGIKIEKENIVASEAIEEFEESQKDKDFTGVKGSVALAEIHKLAIETNASDIHFQTEKDAVHVRFRIDGMLQTVSTIDHKSYIGIAQQIKMNSHLKLNVTDQIQDGQYVVDVDDRTVDMRVSTLPGVFGEAIVLRLLDPKKGIVSLAKLGFKKYALNLVATALSKPEGMILLTGPTGSGKTTTLYSMLDVINKPHRKIVTLEDPVEYKLKGILQCEVSHEKEEGSLSFTDGLIATLRQDPDVIMVGEIREPVVANTAFQAAMTGHLVFSTIHTNSAIETFSRLKNLGVSDYLIAPSMNMIIFQHLLRRICPHCITERDLPKDKLDKLKALEEKLKARKQEVPEIPLKEKYGKGCKFCNNSGYLGRITVSEVLVISDKMRELIQQDAHLGEMVTQAVSEGFINIKEDAMLKVIDGETTMEEVFRVLG